MKKVLVTGAEGFIGSHLVEELVNNGYEVNAFCLYNSFNSNGWLDHLPDNIKKNVNVFMGNIEDVHHLRKALKDCDRVIHLAALISIPYSYVAPESFLKTNINGTLNILQLAREEEVENLIITSTSEVYGTARSIPITEEHPLQPQSPYAASKVGADAMALSFYKSYGLNVSIARPFNTFGPRQSTRAIIPTIITQLLNGKKEIFLGNLSPTRDFLYVKDTVRGFVSMIGDNSVKGEVFNLSSGREISIWQLADTLIKKINPDAQVMEDEKRVRPDSSEVFRLVGDATKLKEKTGWKPAISFEEGLDKTIEWFSQPENLKRYNPGLYTI
ncbi:SDR family NAD(P)-dependent oxidoreductase [Leptobacterium flavescens]|uniref:SDR family NAD(P)-dependent oxidoreductase n=1 Tax=Leptobacterium flavescens TaxID=472055 RepID=A0A6P0UGP1_9FLAO|nr:SDR family NAD(P)-dependent oxidoreductase [Leptobacterium flavescens]NER12187.1 SDR family NAD(P)-dependent oxidoreductase [Leptobacterium flavescens]